MSTSQTDLTDYEDAQPDNTLSIDYTNIDTHQELIDYSQEYAEQVLDEYDIDADLDLIAEWEISTRAKRRAAAIRHLSLTNFDTEVGTPMDWDSFRAEHRMQLHLGSSTFDDPQKCAMNLSWKAFQEFPETEWQSTIRHELIHVEQWQQFGATNHYSEFKDRASTLDTETHCPKFHTGKYLLKCADCGDVKYDYCKNSKNVKRARQSTEDQPLLETTDCCEAHWTVQDPE